MKLSCVVLEIVFQGHSEILCTKIYGNIIWKLENDIDLKLSRNLIEELEWNFVFVINMEEVI